MSSKYIDFNIKLPIEVDILLKISPKQPTISYELSRLTFLGLTVVEVSSEAVFVKRILSTQMKFIYKNYYFPSVNVH